MNKQATKNMAIQVMEELVYKPNASVVLKDFPQVKVLIAELNRLKPSGTILYWGLSNMNLPKLRQWNAKPDACMFNAVLVISEFYTDKEGGIFFEYPHSNWWKVATPNTETGMWVTRPNVLKPLFLQDIRPVLPHIHNNIRKYSAFFRGNKEFLFHWESRIATHRMKQQALWQPISTVPPKG